MASYLTDYTQAMATSASILLQGLGMPYDKINR